MDNSAPLIQNNPSLGSVYVSEEDLASKIAANKFTLKAVLWSLITATAIFYKVIILKSSISGITFYFGYFIAGLIVFVIFKFLSTNQHFNRVADNISRYMFILLVLGMVFLTGNIESPFLFLIFLLPLIMNFNDKFATPVVAAFVIANIIIFEGILSVELNKALIKNPLRYLLTATAPLFISYLYTVNTKHTREHKKDDIQSSKFMEDLSLENKRLQGLVENLNDGIILINNEGNIIYFNRKSTELLHSDISLVKGKNISEYFPGSNLNVNSFQFTSLNLDGEECLVGVNIFPLYPDPSLKLGFVFVIKDITKQVDFEEMKFDFVTMASHQLRTPLTSLKGYVSMLSSSIYERITPDEQVYLNRSMQSIKYITNLIENLLKISNIEESSIPLSTVPLSLERLLTGILGSLSGYSKSKRVRLLFENNSPQAANPLDISGDPYLLSEVVMNLVKNGIDYNREDGTVTVSLSKNQDEFTVFITDTGKGITTQEAKYLFTKFYRASHSLTQKSNGIGISLFMSRKIIEAHKGKIWLENSIEGQGTTFAFTLPLLQAPTGN